jgi:hypothetical protein
VVDQLEWSMFAGFDWGGEHHQLCIIDSLSQRLTKTRLPHDVAGLAMLRRRNSAGTATACRSRWNSEGLLVEDPAGCWTCAVPGVAENRGAGSGTLQGGLGEGRPVRRIRCGRHASLRVVAVAAAGRTIAAAGLDQSLNPRPGPGAGNSAGGGASVADDLGGIAPGWPLAASTTRCACGMWPATVNWAHLSLITQNQRRMLDMPDRWRSARTVTPPE